jgi:hypothetical protein
MRLLGTLAVVAGLLVAPSAGAAAPVPFGFFGISVDGPLFRTDVDQAHEFGLMAKAGAESVITEINWNFLQPHEDQPPNFARIDRVVLNAAKRGMRVMANVIYAPIWAAQDRKSGATPPDPGKYAAFLRALIQRYGTNGGFWAFHPEVVALPILDWQVWNEPPSTGFWSLQPFQKRYVKLLQAARFAIKGTDVNAREVLAGLTFKSWDDLEKIYRAGGKGLFDVVSLHPYTVRPNDVKYIVKLNRRVMIKHGDGKLPVLITELSWPSAKGRTADKYGYEVTPSQQAQRVSEVLPLLAAARTRLHIERVYWHNWVSSDTGNRTFDYSGLREIRGRTITDKPAMAAYRKGVLALEGCKHKGRTSARCG